jgi:putative FmdB family regulatory protein
MGRLMPTYDYACASGHRHEHFCKIADRPTHRECPECGTRGEVRPVRPAIVTHIVVDYPGSKKFKAGYIRLARGSQGDEDPGPAPAARSRRRTKRPRQNGAIWRTP